MEDIMSNFDAGASARPAYKRKVRNYLLDVGLQLRYTATIVIVAVFLTAGLGFKMYQATRDVSKVILWTSLVDPSSAEELQAQFSNSDRVVLWGIVGFGVVLIFSIGTVGILITHKVAGPLHKIASLFGRVRENRMGPAPNSLRKGDELQDFYSSFRDMHMALRARVEEDVRVLNSAVAALEESPEVLRDRMSPLHRTVDELRLLRKRKEESLEGSMTTENIDLGKPSSG
jgi:hypothetical protein